MGEDWMKLYIYGRGRDGAKYVWELKLCMYGS